MTRWFILPLGAVPLMIADAASAQTGPMVNDGMGDVGWMGGYGGYWGPIVLLVVVGLVGWIVMQKRK